MGWILLISEEIQCQGNKTEQADKGVIEQFLGEDNGPENVQRCIAGGRIDSGCGAYPVYQLVVGNDPAPAACDEVSIAEKKCIAEHGGAPDPNRHHGIKPIQQHQRSDGDTGHESDPKEKMDGPSGQHFIFIGHNDTVLDDFLPMVTIYEVKETVITIYSFGA